MPFLGLFIGIATCWAQPSKELYHRGEYQKAIEQAAAAVEDAFAISENWILLKARSELEIGRHLDALKTIQQGLDRYTTSVRIRELGIDVARMNNRPKLARQYLDEIDELWSRSSWRYRGPLNQIAIAQSMIRQRRDAKQILNKILTPAKNNNPNLPDIHIAIAKLALQKYDTPYAAESFQTAAKLEPNNPDIYYGLAMAYRSSNSEKATEALAKALELNPRHVPSRLLQIDQMVNRESYAKAEEAIEEVLKINPHQPDAWAYRAAVANLTNQPKLEGEYRNRALALWQNNPHVDHLIGLKLSQKYRFKESLRYQRRSLIYDPNYLRAKLQLAHDLLRVGNELEGWKVADEVFDKDPYSVVAFNLVTLRDNLSEFTTIEEDGFVIRMSPSESEIYGQHVVALLREAKQLLTEKYDVELETPIYIEIFPRQSDFAIRTFGLPGGAGFLGVCFGRVVTMNSPAAQGPQLTNWRSVLWHEFCHVVTLQKTKNRMPRWLSEGISVYEERLKNPAWGQSMNPRYREMLLGDDLTPISQLSSSFLSPKSAAHLDLAYFQSSLAVEYLIQEHGSDSLKKVLDELALGIPINDSLRRNVAPLRLLDASFTNYVRKRCREFASDTDLNSVDLEKVKRIGEWAAAADKHPANRSVLLGLANSQHQAEQYKASNTTLDKLLQIYPLTRGAESALKLMAENHRKLASASEETQTLEKLVSVDASNSAACLRLLELYSQSQDWQSMQKCANQLIGVNPLIKSPHRYLAQAAEQLNDDQALIQSLKSLVQMDPLDPADSHFRLASALDRQNEPALAKRHVLQALEFAPRYRDAHRLLLKLTASETAEKQESVDTKNRIPTENSK